MAGLSASTHTFIASYTVSGASSLTFANIPQDYTDLRLASTYSLSSSSNTYVKFNFNGDTSANYSLTSMYAGGTSGSGREANLSIGIFSDNFTTTNSQNAVNVLDIMGYSNTNVYKNCLSKTSENGTLVQLLTTPYRSTAPVTNILLQPSTGTFTGTFTLYGIKAADAKVIIPTKAFGGDYIGTDGTYTYHVFKNSGTFVTDLALTCDYLVIAGGGGGGGGTSGYIGGGGGAGGLRSTVTATGGGGSLEAALSLTTKTSYTVTIGAGGTLGVVGNGTNGGNTTFSTVTSIGGGGGGGGQPSSANAGNSGGSGGGGGTANLSGTGGAGGARTTGQGYAGGSGWNRNGVSGQLNGGGGGGAGVAGTNGGNGQLGVGGNGVQITSFATPTNTGANGGYYAGGGGGGSFSLGNAAGGLGGGAVGAQANTGSGINPVINTGSGGSGGDDSPYNGTNGASGLVIVRYAN
jgi:hypothetical protein